MSAANINASSGAATSCTQCGESNSSEAKFCSGCGANLWDKCPSCDASVRKGQKFCDGCGFNLQADFEKRLKTAADSLSRVEELLSQCEFDEANSLALRLINRDDPRMRELAEKAEALAAEAESKKDYWEKRVKEVAELARKSATAQDYKKVVELLSPIPSSVMDETLQKLLKVSRAQASEFEVLTSSLREAIANKDYVIAGGLVDQLLVLQPSDESNKKLAAKIGVALLKSAEKRFAAGMYADALARLDATPAIARDGGEYDELRLRIDNVSWLTEQVARSPFATPALGRLVQRLTKLAPHDQRAPKLLQQLAVKVKEGSKDPLSLFGPWVGAATAWDSSPITILGWPRKIDFSKVAIVKQNPTRFVVSFGLALQGLGLGSFEDTFSSSHNKGSIFKLLRRKNDSVSAWGVDAGAAALRAVKLVRDGDTIRVEDAVWMPYAQPLCRASIELQASVLQRQKLDELAEKLAGDESPVWASVASREVFGRFLTLPPVSEKDLSKLIEQELVSQFPLAADQLITAHSLTGTGSDGSPRAVLLAAKKVNVEQRERVFAEAGIKLAGLQAEPVALHNFARFELKEFFEKDETVNATPDGVCLVDSGATGVNLYVATRDSLWFRFTEGGGEDLTSKLAGALNLTHADAETAKFNLAELPALAKGMEAMEVRLAQTGMRLGQYYQQARQFLGELNLKRILCTGGSPLLHGWTRHIFESSRERE